MLSRNFPMKAIGYLVLGTVLGSWLPAETVLIDHNNTDAGAGDSVREAVVDGGMAADGAVLLSGYDAVTSLVELFPGDLTVSVAGYTAGQNPVLYDGPWHVGFSDSPGAGTFPTS